MIITGLLLGAALGFAMQRGRFCVTGFLRDIFTLHSYRGFIALLIVISVHALGLALLTSTGVIVPSYEDLAPAAVIVGGFIFGLGIVLAGGCASGTWYRSAEGLIGSWIALAMYGLSAAAMKSGALQPLQDALKSRTVGVTTIHESLGISVWPLVIMLGAVTAWFAVRQLRIERSTPRPAALAPARTGLAHLFFERPWHVYATAIVVGVLGVLAWPLSAATGRNTGLGITTPSANLTEFLVTGNGEKIDWGVLLVVGILVGAYLTAKASGEFRLRVPSPNQAIRSVIGGIFMGVGAAWAGGCTVGNGMVETSLFTYQGWLTLAAIVLGVYVAAKLWLKPTTRPEPAQQVTENSAPAEVYSARPQFSFSVAPVGVLEKPITRQQAEVQTLDEGVHTLDMLGAVCPFPLIEAKHAITGIPVGDELEITFDCTQGTDTIPRWAVSAGHDVTRFEQHGDAQWVITVKRGV